MLNDMMQSLLTGLYPMLKESYALDFGQIGPQSSRNDAMNTDIHIIWPLYGRIKIFYKNTLF